MKPKKVNKAMIKEVKKYKVEISKFELELLGNIIKGLNEADLVIQKFCKGNTLASLSTAQESFVALLDLRS